MKVTPACYAHFINCLSALGNGKLCVLLEALKLQKIKRFKKSGFKKIPEKNRVFRFGFGSGSRKNRVFRFGFRVRVKIPKPEPETRFISGYYCMLDCYLLVMFNGQLSLTRDSGVVSLLNVAQTVTFECSEYCPTSVLTRISLHEIRIF